MEIDKIKAQYMEIINNRIKKYSDIILESFIEFYGEKDGIFISEGFYDIAFLHYINDYTIFYIMDSLKQGYNDKFRDVIFMIPYFIYLLKNNFYKQDVTKDNFYQLGVNKIIGVSDDILLSDPDLLLHSIAIALRDNNQNPFEINMTFNQDIKRIIALPAFATSDSNLFHELNHAICSEYITNNGEELIKCGLDYTNVEKNYAAEIINDLLSIEVHNIFKSKCSDIILNNNIMEEVLVDIYSNYHHLIIDFYEKNKERIKLSSLRHSYNQITEYELKSLSKILRP